MTQQRYAFQEYQKEKMAKALGVALPISSKNSYELCNAIRGKKLKQAYAILEGVITVKKPIAFRRYAMDLSHKPGIGAGAFPEKSARYILSVIKSAEANALFKGLNTEDLLLRHICVHKASTPWRAGRQRRRKAKRAHIEVVLAEGVVKQETKSKQKTTK